MVRLASAIVGLLFVGTAVSAEDGTRVYSEPAVPSRAALDRLNLKMAWRARLPVEGRRDGVFSVQITDYGETQQILLQTRSGAVIALDGLTGATQWRARIGSPYVVAYALGYNTKTVLALNGLSVYALSRDKGEILWEFALPYPPTSPPKADEERFYVTLGNGRLHTYILPTLASNVPPTGTPPGGESKPDTTSAPAAPFKPVPRFLWDNQLNTGLNLAPLLTGDLVFLAARDGSISCQAKLDNRIIYRYQAGSGISGQLAQHGETAYIPSVDLSLYALDISLGRVEWHFGGGGAIVRPPTVTDQDIYVAPEAAGLFRLSRATGQIEWRHRNAQRFLAANNKFVYATDSCGQLLILDRGRGTQITSFDGTRDFNMPISNELTDRLYLASHDGLLLCLHDRDYPAPLRMRAAGEPKPGAPAGEAAKPPEQKPDMQKPVKPPDKDKDSKPGTPKEPDGEKKPDDAPNL